MDSQIYFSKLPNMQSIVQTKPNDSVRVTWINDETYTCQIGKHASQCHLLNGKITVFNSLPQYETGKKLQTNASAHAHDVKQLEICNTKKKNNSHKWS